MEEEATEIPQDRYEALGRLLADSRREAIEGRQKCGIETIWDEDEEHYHGIDEYNSDPTWDQKPPGRSEVLSRQITQSTVFANITRPYADAAGARIGDMLVPADDANFSISPTPVPDSLAISKGEIPKKIDEQISQAYPDDPDGAEATKQEVIDKEKSIIDEAKEKSNAAQKRIEDYFVECQYQSHMREVIDDCAKVGSGVLKGPMPIRRVGLAYSQGKMIREEKTSPASFRINYRNFFPDPSCGEDIHRGSYTWERDDITEKELFNLTGGDYYDEQIMAALQEGAHEAGSIYTEEDQGLKKRDKKRLFEIWYHYGILNKKDLADIGIEIEEAYQHVHVVMVNNRVIKVVETHLEDGEFPYDVMVWQKRSGQPWGIGVARQIRVPQKILNGALRMLMDNAGLSGKPMWIILRGLVEPASGDNDWTIYPGKGWTAAEDANVDDVRKAFNFVVPPMLLAELKTIIELAMKMAEDITGLPFLLQGQQGQAPDTVGGLQLMQNNASTVLRRLARLYDDRVTEPHVRRYYRYILQYGEDSEKGDFQIDARGSSALVEREIQNQFILNMGAYVTNPIFKKDPSKWMNEVFKGQRLDPKSMDYDDEEWQQIVEQMSQPPQDSRTQVEQMRQEGRQAELQFKAELDEKNNQFIANQSELDRNMKAMFKQIDAENAMLKEQGKAELTAAQIQARMQESLDKHKVTLATHTQDVELERDKMKLQAALGDKEVVTPPAEPAGRAPDGESFQK